MWMATPLTAVCCYATHKRHADSWPTVRSSTCPTGYVGIDTFTYRADDGSTVSNTATATIDVTALLAILRRIRTRIRILTPILIRTHGPDPPPVDDPGPGPRRGNTERSDGWRSIGRSTTDVLESPTPLELEYDAGQFGHMPTDYLRDPVFRTYFDPVEDRKTYQVHSGRSTTSSFDTGLLWNELNFLNDQLTSQFDVQWFVAGSAKVVTVVLGDRLRRVGGQGRLPAGLHDLGYARLATDRSAAGPGQLAARSEANWEKGEENGPLGRIYRI